MGIDEFNPQTVLIGGVSILTIHLTIMAMFRRHAPGWNFLDRFFDFFNYPVALILVSIATPPWPLYSIEAWQGWIANGLALATLATVAANKVIDADKKKAAEEDRQYEAREQADVYSQAAQLTEDEQKQIRESLKK